MGVRRQAAHLRHGRVDDLVAAVADVAVPERTGGVEIPSTTLVPDVDTFAALEDQLARRRDRRHVGHRVPEARHRRSLSGVLTVPDVDRTPGG